jgi:hypothetical protein
MWCTEPSALGRHGPGMVRVLPRHTRQQDAGSVDLTYSEEELDQEN